MLAEYQCTGCSACVSVCPQGAMKLKLNARGFYRPQVDDDKCIVCGRCVNVCPVRDDETHQALQKAYYGWSKSQEDSMGCSSGAFFYVLAKEILRSGGIVYGAVFANRYKEVVIGNTDEYSLEDMRLSKYVASSADGSFCHAKHMLLTGRTVLYTGSPCQIAGLKKFLGEDYGNLYTASFLCGGMPSAGYWSDYLSSLERKYCSTTKKICFREKDKGWKHMRLKIWMRNGRTYEKNAFLDGFYVGFLNKTTVDNVCAACPFSVNHWSDIIFGDFWGYASAGIPYRKEGISLIVVNSDKGWEINRIIEPHMQLKEIGLNNVQYAFHPRKPDEQREATRERFFAEALASGFSSAEKKYIPCDCLSCFRMRGVSLLLKLKRGR